MGRPVLQRGSGSIRERTLLGSPHLLEWTFMPIERITLFCFAASYGLAMALELFQLARPAKAARWLCLVAAGAGLLAHTLFLLVQRPPLAGQFGSLLFLAWILAVFYVYGSIHHRNQVWSVFALPLVLGLVILAALFAPGDAPLERMTFDWPRFWGILHGTLLLLAAVGVCVGFLASLMYLVQARRLKTKTRLGHGLRLLSLERLEDMNRRAIILAFPLLTAGVVVGAVLMAQERETIQGWTDPKVLGAIVLWLVFVLLLYLRYGLHLRGRRLAFLTILAFALLLITLASPSHHFVAGGGP